MAPRPVATGTISFGLVSIPVRLYSATQPASSVSFNLLHDKDGARLKQQYVCSQCGEKVERDQTVKGYEFAKDRYVRFTAEELEALEEIASQTIDIAEFVPASDVDAVHYEKAYYLSPEKGGAKAYRLLSEAMRRSGRAALARYAARGKQYLVLIRPREGRLVMQQLFYADEVRPFDEIPLDEAEVKEQEIQLALQLVEQIAADRFEPGKYEDAVKKRTLAAIEGKVQGQEIQVAAPEPQAQVIDLMEALKASLAAGPARPPPAAPEPEAKAEAAASEERKPARRAARPAPEERKKGASRK
ncbi:MAG TPA: Ku protein [Anaeromyxobacteraceae bacterium]|nr:Ku protein [Anaeromyxobacteraceae bacterium]